MQIFPWGKLHRSQDQTSTHPLLDHMTDVAAVLHRLLLIPAIARALERAADRPLGDTDRARLAVLVYLHDIGKANAGFQGKYWSEQAQCPTGWPSPCGHGPEGWDLIDACLSGQHWAQQVTAGLPLATMEQATHGEALDAIAQNMGPDWVKFGQDYEGTLAANKTTASLHTLDVEREFGEQYFPDDVVIGSRLGAADRMVVFDPSPTGPFGLAVQQLALRHHMLPHGLPDDVQPDQIEELAPQAGFTSALGGRRYRYDRFGLATVAKAQD